MAFEKIIGYEDVKAELMMLADRIINPDKYNGSRGFSPLQGVLLYGSPGTGKSTLAECFAEYCGRKPVFLRKDVDGERFLDRIKTSFEEAKKEKILICEDIDKYSESSSITAAEWAALQSAIDANINEGILIISTANDISDIPDSLLRPGRFDLKIEIHEPKGETATAIIRHYLADIDLAEDVDPEEIAQLLPFKTCAALEAVIRQADMMRIYEGKPRIERKHLIDAVLKVAFSFTVSDDLNQDSEEKKAVCTHEAGHCVVARWFNVEVTMLTVASNENFGRDGVTLTNGAIRDAEDYLIEAMISIGGRVAMEIINNSVDTGSEEDLEMAVERIKKYFQCCAAGCTFARRHVWSEINLSHLEDAVASKMSELFQRTRQIVSNSMDLLLEVRDQMLEKGTLTYKDIHQIEDRLNIKRKKMRISGNGKENVAETHKEE